MENGQGKSGGVTHTKVWSINPAASAGELEDQVSQEIMQAQAMASVIYGQGLDNFNCMIDTEKGNYLWAIHMKLCGISALHDAFVHRLRIELQPEYAQGKPGLSVVGADRRPPDRQ